MNGQGGVQLSQIVFGSLLRTAKDHAELFEAEAGERNEVGAALVVWVSERVSETVGTNI